MKTPTELEKDDDNITGKIQEELPNYKSYPASEDIYLQSKEETEINPTDTTKTKTPNELSESMNEKDFKENISGDDLDIPGSELDDEENNYYSLGGNNHNDLEEDKG